MIDVRLTEIISLEIYLEKILSRIDFEWEVIILDDRESRNSFVALCCSYFNISTLKSPRRKTVFCSLASFSKSGLR